MIEKLLIKKIVDCVIKAVKESGIPFKDKIYTDMEMRAWELIDHFINKEQNDDWLYEDFESGSTGWYLEAMQILRDIKKIRF